MFVLCLGGAGLAHAGGEAVAWGSYWNGTAYVPKTVPPGLSNVVALGGGQEHSLVLQADGTVTLWGSAYAKVTNAPVALTNIVAVACGGYHSMVLRADGTVASWGYYSETEVPNGLSKVVAVAAGQRHCLALRADGTVAAWGSYWDGQTYVPMLVPPGLSDVVAVAAGYHHNLALRADGTVVAWGLYQEGGRHMPMTTPQGLSNMVAIAAGGQHALALRSDGTVFAWGSNDSGQLDMPNDVTRVVALAGGYAHSLALRFDGTVVAWGTNSVGQTVVPAGLSNAVAVASGFYHSFALISRVANPVQIAKQPEAQTVDRGGSASLFVLARGTPPVRYQWQFNGADIPGATHAAYTIRNAQAHHVGEYTVVVSNGAGHVTSHSARLIVEKLPEISASWAGSDDFSGGVLNRNWTFHHNNNGLVRVLSANGHASFIVSEVLADDTSEALIWHGHPNATEDWTVEVTGYLSAPSSRLQLWALRTDTFPNNYYYVEMYRKAGRGFIVDATGARRVIVDATNTLFSLRLVFRSAVDRIEAWCDPDAAGRNWKMLDSISLADLSPTMTASNTFSFAINVIAPEGGAPIPEGEIWADDFRVSAPGGVASPGSLGVSHEWHTATLLADGRVLVAGGYTGGFPNGTYPAAAELYDPASGKWALTGALSNPRGRHTATLIPDGKVLVIGGAGPGGVLNTVERYEPTTGGWTTLAPLGTARAVHAATLLPSGEIVVVGGTSDGTGALATAEVYEPATGRWTPTSPMAVARCYPGAVLLCDGRMLVAGGAADARGNRSLASCEIYDPVSRSWTTTGSMAVDRQMHSVTALADGRVLAVGGEDSREVQLASTELYDPARAVWTTASPLSWARKWHTANLLSNGKVLVVGGSGNDGYPAEIELYDPTADKWTTQHRLNAPRYWHTGTLLPNGDVLVTGGGTGDGPAFSSIELLDLPAEVTGAVSFQDLALLPGGRFHFTFHSAPSLSFQVLATPEWGGSSASWILRGAPIELCPGYYAFTDRGQTNDAQCFFRVQGFRP